ncbi:hypothetical protein SO802_008255 [Lithocarpus litseifolius]|uniref:Uncharacterized protein n=1 Tax=Lithocarpus litseifolius TaxID=425828 RepID=A0AAW2D847_9ROSI
MIVYDISKRQSFDHVAKWLEELGRTSSSWRHQPLRPLMLNQLSLQSSQKSIESSARRLLLPMMNLEEIHHFSREQILLSLVRSQLNLYGDSAVAVLDRIVSSDLVPHGLLHFIA